MNEKNKYIEARDNSIAKLYLNLIYAKTIILMLLVF